MIIIFYRSLAFVVKQNKTSITKLLKITTLATVMSYLKINQINYYIMYRTYYMSQSVIW